MHVFKIFILTLYFTGSAWCITSLVPTLKDGSYSSNQHEGVSKSLNVNGNTEPTSAWAAFDLQSYNINSISNAYLILYIQKVNSIGTLEVNFMTNTPLLENGTNGSSLGVGASIGSVDINSTQEESLITLDITSDITSSEFKGIILSSSSGLDVVIASKESGNSPVILLKHTLSTTATPEGNAGGDLTNSYPNPSIKDSAITSAKISAGAVLENAMADNSVSSVKIQDGAVTSQKLTTSSVTEGKISSSAVSTDKIASSAVTTVKLNDGAVIDSKIAAMDYGKLTNVPNAFSPSTHNHSSDNLNPNSIQFGSTGNFPKLRMMTWTFFTDNQPLSLKILNLDSLPECPNPTGIVHLSGILTEGNRQIPNATDVSGLVDYWDVKYEINNSGPDNLRLSHPNTGTQNKKVTVFAIFIDP